MASPKKRAQVRISAWRGVNEDLVGAVYFNVAEVSRKGALRIGRGPGITDDLTQKYLW